ncbi:NAD-glutamate dehydrogenase [Nocardioides sp. R-C-SC26]|uniref:NAD-glutamate dehydrogenase n=1 Tax=Nocardioides sp. R-C-SC26 TaxID=2870414 RepID=UPI001E36C458|nr:NAD-glutamate dehydrogenase [Nocardioides sp. R-C-SC26]
MSTSTHLPGLSELIDQAAEHARHGKGSGGPPHGDIDELLRCYFRQTTAEDLADRTAADVFGAFASHYRVARLRTPGQAVVRVSTPSVSTHGWSAGGHSVVEVVTDDMPFLVDSLTMELSRQLRDVHLVVHPNLDVERDGDGELLAVRPVEDGAAPPAEGWLRESWMHVEIDRVREGDALPEIVAQVERVLGDVRVAVEDWPQMQARIQGVVAGLSEAPPPVPRHEIEQAAELLGWLAAGHFTFLGYREYVLERVEPEPGGPDRSTATDGEPGEDDVLRPIEGTGLGILRASRSRAGTGSARNTTGVEQAASASFARLPDPVKAKAREKHLLVLAKANSRATVHRPAYLDYVGVKTFDESGEVRGEHRFLGLFSSAAYTESLLRIPLVREKVAEVVRRSGFDPQSHDGKTLLDTLETYPRDDLFHTPVGELGPLVRAAMQARERRAVRMFVRRDTYGRYASVLVYLPRDRYNTAVRERFSRILTERFDADSVEFNARLDESTTARVHFVVHVPRGALVPELDAGEVADLERRLADAARSWRDDLTTAVLNEYGEEVGAILGRRYADSFPEAYKEDFAARVASVDIGRLEAVIADPTMRGVDHALYQELDAAPGEARLKIYRIGPPLSLSEVLPVLTSLGVEVVDERPYGLDGLTQPTFIYEFGLRYPGRLPDDARDLFHDAVRALWDGRAETDGFNRLVLAAQLTWRQVSVLRAYAKYMRQGLTPFGLDSLEEALLANAEITRMVVELFEARFDPDQHVAEDPRADGSARAAAQDAVEARILAALDDVASLDHDRVLRSYLAHVRATLRTNYYSTYAEGAPQLSLKLEPSTIPDLPEPRPRFEIFVYAPRVEGVHLRFGAVARGGLRWSDRRDDFRTEILGLVKAQMVKNTVIVPVGAKGGFYAKNLPVIDPADPGTREAWLAEGVDCYRTFIRGLLDVTDNLVEGQTAPPARVVRHDGDDSYLVVAADKGTATFSDIANGIALDYGFWLGDAFASGGSVGYDHKAMGITARGAWVSVRRHFREMGIDCQAEDITCIGIGDMSGDVFGNGMLCSEHIRLVAAFDHRDIFIDPEPDAAASFTERRRLFDLPRSSWQDYDRSLISEGGGVFSRSAKSVPLNAAIRTALGLPDDVAKLTPSELIKAILLAPVDLLWNGGIGTYVKAVDETNLDVGDKANDAIRVNGEQLRVRCVGEGGNLGLTQGGRIEYALAGGRVNTDFIDNSAGVDTSDHEVNIKILLDRVVATGDLTGKQRNAVLAEMTDEVADLVLRDNYEQNLALANAAANAAPLLHVHESWMWELEGRGVLNRDLEALPSSTEVAARLERGEGLTVPELSVLMAWTKIVLADELLASDLPDDPYLDLDLRAYFPTPIQQRFLDRISEHPLRREIIVTQVVGDLVNGAGFTYWPRLAGETAASAAELTRANFVAREIFGSLALRTRISACDNLIDAAVQTRMRIEMRTLVERASRWLVVNRRAPLESQALVDHFSDRVQRVMAALPDLLVGEERSAFEERRDALADSDVEDALATAVAVLPPAYMLLHVVDVADSVARAVPDDAAAGDGVDLLEVARLHLVLGERLGLPRLVRRILALPRDDRWQTMARATLRDDLHAVHAELTRQVIEDAGSGDDSRGDALDVDAAIAAWEAEQVDRVERTASTLADICADDAVDLARMSVALRVVRGLLR